jgi:hypothetical protein
MDTGHPERFAIERLSAGELSGYECQHVESHLATCDSCRAFFEDLEAEREALMVTHPPTAFAAHVMDRVGQGPGGFVGFLSRPVVRWLGLGLAAAAATVVLLWWPGPLPQEEEPSFRLMGGGTTTRVFFRREGQVRLYSPKTQLQAGDALRVEVTTAQTAWATLLAVSNGDEPPLVLSPESDQALAVRDQTVLPGSVEITDDPEPLLLLLVVRESPYRTADLAREVDELRGEQDVRRWLPPRARGGRLSGLVWSQVVDMGSVAGE